MRIREIEYAIQFDELPIKNVNSWTAFIGGLVKKDYHKQTPECFRGMQLLLLPLKNYYCEEEF